MTPAIPPDASTYERLERMTHDLGALVEELGSVVYRSIEAEVLKEVAIEVGVDWTTDHNDAIAALATKDEIRDALIAAGMAGPLARRVARALYYRDLDAVTGGRPETDPSTLDLIAQGDAALAGR